MFECDCEEMIKRGETVQVMELRIAEKIRQKENIRDELKAKETLTEEDNELLYNILPSEISCLKTCRDHLQAKWFSSSKKRVVPK